MISSTISFRTYIITLIVGIFTAISIAVTSTELIVRFLVEPNHNFFKHLEFVKTIEASCAALGDSHTALGFAGNNECINFAYPSESFSDTYKKIKYLKTPEKLRKVIIQTDPIIFSKYRLDAKQSTMLDYLSATVHQPPLRLLDKLHSENLLRYWRTLLFKWKFVPVFDVRETGWMAYNEQWQSINPAERSIRAKKEAVEQLPIHKFSKTTTANLLKNMIESFVNQGVKICLVTYPVSSEFLKVAEKNSEFQSVLTYFKNLANEHHIEYINMLRWQKNDTSLFANADHLNIKGAELFTKNIIELCRF